MLKELKPEKPIEYFILSGHLVNFIGTFVFEVMNLKGDVRAIIVLVFVINILWTVTTLAFLFRAYIKFSESFDLTVQEKEAEIKETENQFKQKQDEFERKQREFERKVDDLNDSLISSVKKQKELLAIAKYADALPDINSAFGEVHRIMRQINALGGCERQLSIDIANLNPEQLKKAEQEINEIIGNITKSLFSLCGHTAAGFRILTGDLKVAVCIKAIIGKDNLLERSDLCYVKNLVRDLHSYDTRGMDVKGASGEPLMHSLVSNTSFSTIFQSIKSNHSKPFFCNRLPLLSGYWNSSFLNPNYGIPAKRPGQGYSPDELIEAWTLPYKSCIVFPLLPNHVEDKELDKLEGFFCLDSEEMDVFNEKYDSVLLAGLSDGVYNKVQLLNKLLDKSNKIKETLKLY